MFSEKKTVENAGGNSFGGRSIDIRVVCCVVSRLDRVRRRRVCKGMQMRSEAGSSGGVKGGD